jgi:hypothetical protein
MESRLQVVAILGTAALLLVVLELVRRRRVMERYALLWLFSSVVLLVLSIWSGLLEHLASSVGIETPSNALFAIAFGFTLVLLLHFSTVISGLTDQNKVLAQRLALLQQRLDELEERAAHEAGAPSGEAELEPEASQPELTRHG